MVIIARVLHGSALVHYLTKKNLKSSALNFICIWRAMNDFAEGIE